MTAPVYAEANAVSRAGAHQWFVNDNDCCLSAPAAPPPSMSCKGYKTTPQDPSYPWPSHIPSVVPSVCFSFTIPSSPRNIFHLRHPLWHPHLDQAPALAPFTRSTVKRTSLYTLKRDTTSLCSLFLQVRCLGSPLRDSSILMSTGSSSSTQFPLTPFTGVAKVSDELPSSYIWLSFYPQLFLSLCVNLHT
jgi:hypothetical protein